MLPKFKVYFSRELRFKEKNVVWILLTFIGLDELQFTNMEFQKEQVLWDKETEER